MEGGAPRNYQCVTGRAAGVLDFSYVIGVSAISPTGELSRAVWVNLEILTQYANDKRYMSKRNLLRWYDATFGLRFTYDRSQNCLVPFDYEAFAAWPGSGCRGHQPGDRKGRVSGAPPRTSFCSCRPPVPCRRPPIYDLMGSSVWTRGANAIPFRRAFQREP